MTICASLRAPAFGAALSLFACFAATNADAATFSFVGNINSDDEVQLFNFTIANSSNVILKTLSWAGGVNAEGDAIAAGGFDPILAVFGPDGTKINDNDDGNSSQVPQNSGEFFDTYLELGSLAAGTYTVAVTQFDNFAGSTLASAFSRAGQGNFTGAVFGCTTQVLLCAVGGLPRDSHWAFDILGVDVASNPTGNGNGNPPPVGDVPVPGAVWLLGSALAMLGGLRRFRKIA
jgi:hypothetical protein